MKNKKLIVLVLLIIAAAIAGIYFIKNPVAHHNPQSNADIEEMEQETIASTNHGEADFSLAVMEIVDYEVLSAYGLPIIVDYGSDSCIPCKQMAPVLEKMNEEMQGKAFIKFVDVWKYTDAANNVPVQVIPTQVLVSADGTAFVPSDALASQIEFTMYSDRNTGDHIFTVHQGGITEEQMRLILTEMGVTE